VNGQLELTTAPTVAILSFTQDDIDNNRVVYVHDGSNTIADSFDFDVDDGQGNVLAGQSFALTITPVDDDAPVQVTNAGSTVLEGGTDTLVTAEVLYTDTEQPATSVTYTVTTAPVNGQLELITAPTVAILSFTQDDIDNNRVVYVHDGSNTLADSFDFDVDDGQGNVLAGQSFSITVTPANAPPTTTGIADVTVNEDSVDSIINIFSAFDDSEDADAALVYSITNNTNASLFSGTPIDGVGGTLTLDFAANANGTAAVTLRATDQGGAFVETTFNVTVNPVNDAPVLVGNSGIALENNDEASITASGLQVLDIDDAASQITYTLTNVSFNGTLKLNGVALSIGDSFTQDDINKNRVSYASHSAGSPNYAAFTFSVTDGSGASIGATAFTVTIQPSPEPALPEPPDPELKPEPGEPAPEPPMPEEEIGYGIEAKISPEKPEPIALPQKGLEIKPVTLPEFSADLLDFRNRHEHEREGRAYTPKTKFERDRNSADGERHPDPLVIERPIETSEVLKRALDSMSTQLQDFAEAEQRQQIIQRSLAEGGGAILSVGYLAWLLRAGPLLASALTAIPAWAKFDPLPVLLAGKKRKEERDARREKEDRDEATVARILDAVRSVSSIRKGRG
jgi:hypothetical protein